MGIFDGCSYIVYTFEDSSVAFEWQPGASFNSIFVFFFFFLLYTSIWIGVWTEEMM